VGYRVKEVQPLGPQARAGGAYAGQVGSAVAAPAAASGGEPGRVLKVLWVSRHKPVPVQVSALQRYAERRGLRLEIDYFTQAVPSAEWLVSNVVKPGGYAVVVPVLPLSFIMHLVEEGKKAGFEVWFSRMQLLHNDAQAACPGFNPETDTMQPGVDAEGKPMYRHYRFSRFERIVDVKLVTEPVEAA